MTGVGQDLKVQGQQDSLLDLLQDHAAAFFDVMRSIPPGTVLSINDIRGSLDAAGIPAAARGGMFAKAVKAGLLEPEVIEHAGHRIPVTVPSTGASAHAATVRVYRRVGGEPR